MAASSSNTAGQPNNDPRNASDGLRILLPAPQVSAFDGLIIAQPTSVSTSAEFLSRTKQIPYDVFINHHGVDTKHTVANSIYTSLHAAGFRVFLDKNELKPGDFFPRALEESMRSASLHIAIFSEHYAESPWCLAELAFILGTGTKIIPIFYHVEPLTLRWAIKGKGRYADALSKYEMKSSNTVSHVLNRALHKVSFLIGGITNSDEHEKKRRYSSEQLQRWKLALHKASLFTGHIVNNQEDEQRVVKNVVNYVLKETNKELFEVAKHPVGVDEAVQNFDTIALQSGGSIKIVGIWGLGGSGKTTLAKNIFNIRRSAMDRSSFLFDLRDAAGKGLLVEKQKKLLEDLDAKCKSFDNVDEGKVILKSSLRSVSALIILDDVDHADQLDALLPARESLGQGSLIVVTTRDLDVLIACGITAIYEMRPLNDTHAKQLFCWHAFLQPSPLPGFEDLVEKFLNACKGLPLSLKVLGAQLYGRSRKDYWHSQLDKISRILPADIKSRLEVSYDALDDEEKEMFLDIACFFIGERKSVAIAVWEGSGWSGLQSWEKLFNKCLVEVYDGGIRMFKVEDDDYIRMHDHLRDLGREIANRQSPYRLWSPQQSIQIHSQQEAIQIRGLANAIGDNCYLRQGNIIIHTSLGERTLTLPSLGLKIFVGNGDFFNQDQGGISRELVWLQCKQFEHKNLPSWLPLKRLRVLELFNARSLEGLWEREADAPLQLRELVISNCNRLREFPRSIGHLKNLKNIILNGTDRWHTLVELPQEFCSLQLLEHLEIKWCQMLSSLPSNFGELANLQFLNFSYCTELKMLPDSFKKLTNLQHLELRQCYKLKVLLDSFKNLTLLEHLNLQVCPEVIINSESHVLENMKKLRYLNLSGCKKLEELRLPGVAPLTRLNLIGTSLKELPANIFQLTKLTYLVIGSEFLQALPSSIENLSSLTILGIYGCKKLEALPDSLEHLNCLKDLVINESGVKCLPTLPATLKNIYVSDCSVLKDIGGARGLKNLKTLEIRDCPGLEVLPTLSEITSLQEVKLIRCDNLKVLLDSFKNLTLLEHLNLDGCREVIINSESHVLENMKKLRYLNLNNCKKLEELRLPGVPSLTELNLRGTSLKELPANIFQLTKLTNLEIGSEFLQALPSSIENLSSLTRLVIVGCKKLEALPDSLEHLNCLKDLVIKESGVKCLPTLPASLNKIYVSGCSVLKDIGGARGLKNLKTLVIEDCVLPSLPAITSLQEVQLSRCHKLEKIEGLQGLRSLETLEITDCPELNSLPSFEGLTSLKKLEIGKCSELEVLPSLSGITSLERIVLRCDHKLKKIEGLQGLRSLETLEITDCPELNSLPSFEGLTSLKKLEISKCSELEVLPSLSGITSLERIVLRCDHKLEKIEEGLENLISLEVHSQQNVVNLEQCERLERLVVVTSDRSDVKPYISNIQKWPRDVMICTRAVMDVGSLKKFFEKLPNLSVVDYSAVHEEYRVKLKRPQSSANVNAILICFIIESFDNLVCIYSERYLESFSTELGEGKWAWVGVFTQGSSWLQSTEEYIPSRNFIPKVEEAWLVMGEEGSIVKAFHQLFER